VENRIPAVQGEKCVILVRGDMYFELLHKDGDGVDIMGPTGGMAAGSIAQLQAAGFVGRQAVKLVKTDGSWMYMAMGDKGLDLYVNGRFSPSTPVGRQSVRTI
jgi:hypothetical protein